MQIIEKERILKALASRRRLAIIDFLNKVGNATVSQIAKEIRLSIKSTSKHLSILAKVNIVEFEQRHKFIHYSLARPKNILVRSLFI